jgi:hypothetical protein
MSKSTYPLKLPTSVKKAAAELAATDGVFLNQFIAAGVAGGEGRLATYGSGISTRMRRIGEAQGHAEVPSARAESCSGH